jgi:hypothetical protein
MAAASMAAAMAVMAADGVVVMAADGVVVVADGAAVVVMVEAVVEAVTANSNLLNLNIQGAARLHLAALFTVPRTAHRNIPARSGSI